MNAYHLAYPSGYLGGNAIVFARDRAHAKRELLRRHADGKMPMAKLSDPEDITVLKLDMSGPGVHEITNGDY